MTPNDLIKLALKMTGVVGVGQTPLAEDLNDAFSLLNMMLGQWSRRRWLIYHLMDVAVPMTGATSYTIGPGATINVPRIDMIESAYVRLNSDGKAIDFPLGILTSYEDWAGIPYKTQTGFPQSVFLDSGAPTGTIYVWPVPTSQYELHLIMKSALTAFGGIDQAVTLPNEYQEALLYNLVTRLRPAYGLAPDPGVTALAGAALNTIRNANAQIPFLQMPDNLVGGGSFNIYSGQGS